MILQFMITYQHFRDFSQGQKPNLAAFFSDHQKPSNSNDRAPSLFSSLFGGSSPAPGSQVQRLVPPSLPHSMPVLSKPINPPANIQSMSNTMKTTDFGGIPNAADHVTPVSDASNDAMQVDSPTPSKGQPMPESSPVTMQRPSAPLPFVFSTSIPNRFQLGQNPAIISPLPVRPLGEVSSSQAIRQKRAADSDLTTEAPSAKVRKLDDAPMLFSSQQSTENNDLPPEVHRQIEITRHAQQQSQADLPQPPQLNLPPPSPMPQQIAPPSPSPFKAPSQPFRPVPPSSPAPRSKPMASNLPSASIQKSLSELPLQRPSMDRDTSHQNRMSVDTEPELEPFQFEELREEFLRHTESHTQMLNALKNEMDIAAERMKEVALEMLIHNNEMLALQATTVMDLDASLKAASIRGEE
jgi:hypothetical protein